MTDNEDPVSQAIIEIYMESSPEPEELDKTDQTKILTDEILLLIFSFLEMRSICRVSKVCRRWDIISKDRLLWKDVNLTPITYALNEIDFKALVKSKLTHTQKLNTGSLRLTFKMLRKISSHCEDLKVLIFGRNSSIEQASRRRQRIVFPKTIETLDLRQAIGDFEFLVNMERTFYNLLNLGIGPRSFTRYNLSFLLAKLPNLVILDFTNCLEIDDEGVKDIAQSCPNIESLCLIGCRNVRGTSFDTLLRYCWNLKTLLLRYLKIEDDILQSNIWKDCVIEELDISACPRITWQGLFTFLTQLKHIKYLNMSYCGEGHAVNDIVMAQMASSGIADNLKMLDLRWSFHVSPGALGILLKNCKQLEHLGLYQSLRVTADDLATLLVHLPFMKILEYGGSFPQELNRSKIIPKLMTSAKQLEVLSLINFTSLSLKDDYKYLKAFMKKCVHLKRINFCDCTPELVKIGKDAVKGIKNVQVTIKWECALPPPTLTLDSIVL